MQPGHQEVDVPRARLAHDLVAHRARVAAAGGALEDVVDDRAAEPRLRARRIEAIAERVARAGRGRHQHQRDTCRPAARCAPPPRRAARTCTPPAASAPVTAAGTPGSTPTATGSGPVLRNASPSAIEIRTGNPNTQNSAPGSRLSSRSRISVSCDERVAARVSPAQASRRCRPVSGDEHVLQGRVPGASSRASAAPRPRPARSARAARACGSATVSAQPPSLGQARARAPPAAPAASPRAARRRRRALERELDHVLGAEAAISSRGRAFAR